MSKVVTYSASLVRVVFLFLNLSVFLISPLVSEAFKLPDTGQTTCYQGVGPYAEIPCGDSEQDGEYNINPMSFDSVKNFSHFHQMT